MKTIARSAWVVEWSNVSDDEDYIVCPVNCYGGSWKLGRPTGILKGWEVKRMIPRCYAALLMPEFRMPPKPEPMS